MESPFKPQSGASSFLPQDYIARKAEARANIFCLSLFAVVLACVLGAFVVTNRSWKQLKARQEIVSTQYAEEAQKIEQLKALESQRSQMMEKAELTAGLIEKVPRWALMAEVCLRLREEMCLNEFTIKSRRIEPQQPTPAPGAQNRQQPQVRSLAGTPAGSSAPGAAPARPAIEPTRFEYTLTLVGYAVRNNDIADFLTSLKQSPALADVELQFIRDAKLNNNDVRMFEITARVMTDVDADVLANSVRRVAAAWHARNEPAAGQQAGAASTPAVSTPGASTRAEEGQP
jgi:Tfp pilus assembly protein PilN